MSIIRRNNCITLYGWLSGMKGAPCIPDSHPYKYQVSHKYRCFSWWWAHSHPKHVEKRNILRKIVHQVGFIYKIIQGCTVTKHKIYLVPCQPNDGFLYTKKRELLKCVVAAMYSWQHCGTGTLSYRQPRHLVIIDQWNGQQRAFAIKMF